jgi:hypothetical protein
MYSTRKTTKTHGQSNLFLLIFILVVTSLLIRSFGINYLVIFLASGLLHVIIESGLAISGVRKGSVYLYNRELPRFADVLLRSFVEGPAFCVPAYFVSDQFYNHNPVWGVIGAVLVVAIASLYLGMADKKSVNQLQNKDEVLISRREMTKPAALMLLALLNTCCLVAMFLIPQPERAHAFIYLISYALLVMLFYLINYNLGVRYVETYDCETKQYKKPGPWFQAASLTYDSAYEMAILISPAYWVTFYLGFFQ